MLLSALGALALAGAVAAAEPAAPVLDGTVSTPDGRVPAGALVVARPAGDLLAPAVVGRTDEKGRFQLTLASAAPHAVRVEAPGAAPFVRERVPAGRPLRVVLTAGGSLDGTVRDASGAPAAGAVVEARDLRARELGVVWDARFGAVRATTDAQGRYRLTGIGAGPYAVTAVRGHSRAQRRSVAAGTRVDFVLLPSSSVQGTLAGPDGRPAAGALVRLEPSSASSGPGERMALADEAGRFQFAGVEPGEYRLIVRHETLAPAWQSVTVDRRADVDASLRLGPPAAVVGRLVDSQSRPLRGRVSVRAIGAAAPPRSLSPALSVEAGADGTFRLAPLPAGPLSLTAAAARLAPRRLDVQIAAGASEVELGAVVLDTGLAIRGLVRTVQGRPVPDARVTTAAGGEDVSGPDGSFVLAGLDCARCRVSVQAAGFAALDRDVDAGTEGVQLVLQEAGRITGVIVDDAGAPVTRYQVVVRPQPSATRLSGAPARRDVESPDGRFVFEDLPADTYVLSVAAPDRAPGGVSNVAVAPGGVADVGTIRLETGGTVRGTVVDAGGAAVAGATLRAAPPRRMLGTLGAGTETASDASGAFELRGLAAGPVRITARHPEYAEGEAIVEVPAATGRPAEAQVVLQRGGRVEGQARHRDGSAVAGMVALQPIGASGPIAFSETLALRADGTFAADHVAAGRVRLVLMTGSGILSGGPEREVDVREGATATVTFELREVVLGGRVTRAGTPAAGLRVTVTPDRPFGAALAAGQPPAAGPDPHSGLTREDGRFEVVADQPGRVRISVEAPDGSLRLPPRTAEIPDLPRHEVDLDFGGVVLAGTVVEEQTDRPLARAVVLADPHGQVTQGQAVTTVTDADGRFQLEVESGRYRVSARVDGFSSATTEVEIDGASVTDLRLPLGRGGIIRGRVVDARGRAAGDGVVRAFSATTGAGAATAPLLPDGRFELSGLAEGEYALAARSDAGGFALRAGVATGADEVTLVLRGGGRVQAKLVGPDGAPVAGASVSVFRVDGALFPGIAGGSVSDRDGLAVIASPAGAVEIRAARLEGPVLESGGTSIVVVEEGGTAAAEVVLEKPATALPPD